jgi:hypothetical protein
MAKRPLSAHKARLRKLLAKSNGISFNEHFAGDGAEIFAKVCALG